MRIGVDTNVLVSAALRDRDPQEVVFYIVGTPGVEWIATPAMMTEYREVLRRPTFGLAATVLEEWDRLLDFAVLVVDGVPAVQWTAIPAMPSSYPAPWRSTLTFS
jgi:uncharacterized protein